MMKFYVLVILFSIARGTAAAQIAIFDGETLSDDYDTAFIWNFSQWNDRQQWTIPQEIFGGVRGGALWVAIQPDWSALDLSRWEYMVWGKNYHYELSSPSGLGIDASRYNKVRIRLLNHSPETDGWILWRTENAPGQVAGPLRFAMQPDCRDWQEVTCHIDGRWSGVIDQLVIIPATLWFSGDIWIGNIAITRGPDKTAPSRPDLMSSEVVPQIDIRGISQSGFQDAFNILDECLVTEVPMMGFNYPFMAPGGIYGHNWWQLDGSLNVAGAKWVSQDLVEGIVRGFAEVQSQNPDGRIDLWGGSVIRGQVADVSSIPRFFEAAWDVARRCNNTGLQEEIYVSMKNFLGYWFSDAKRDRVTGLITAVFEESLGPNMREDPGTNAAVDLNVAVAVGCFNTSRLAQHLGYQSEASRYGHMFTQLCQSINQYLWHEGRKAYLNYNVKEKEHFPDLLCTTFDPLQLSMVPPDRVKALLDKLLDPDVFNWGIHPVTSVAKTEPAYRELTGTYNDTAWSGDVWTMRNIPVIRGLEIIGRHDLAAELTWSTINTFHNNFCEFVAPSTGSGEGVQRYGWTASQYIEAIIEHLFGIDYDGFAKRLRICPHLPEALKGETVTISNLRIPGYNNTRLSLTVKQDSLGKASVGVEFSGQLPDGVLEVLWPVNGDLLFRVSDSKGASLPVTDSFEGLRNVKGTRIPISRSESLTFQMDY